MRNITLIACLLVSIIATAQFSEPGFYRVRNVGSDSYISIKGTKFNKTTRPDAFWPCVVMVKHSDESYISDPGTVIYIPGEVQTSLYAQGVSTYSITGLLLDIESAPFMENGIDTYVAKTIYEGFRCYFRDLGQGMTAGSSTRTHESHWWIEPLNQGSIDTSFLSLKPVIEVDLGDTQEYWGSICVDYPILIPEGSGVEGIYTVKEIVQGSDSLYYAEPIKLYGQGDTIPGATPYLFKCTSPDIYINKVLPVGFDVNRTAMPITNDLLMGNYFSSFENHCDLVDHDAYGTYIPTQSTKAQAAYMALTTDENGNPVFEAQAEDTYMKANTAWLNISVIPEKINTPIHLGKAPVEQVDPEDPEDPEIIKGDINGDDALDIEDVTLLLQQILTSGYSQDGENIDCSDMNEDGVVDIDDVIILINLVLNSD